MLTFSVVLLTYKRPDSIVELLEHLRPIRERLVDLIVVDNSPDNVTEREIAARSFDCEYIRTEENLGACGRNIGIARAAGDVIITLDDDVFGLTDAELDHLARRFAAEPDLACVNFKVIDYYTLRLANWVHHRPVEDAEKGFATYEITEGGAAFRHATLQDAGLYWQPFFISHEGPDLAFRMMDCGGAVVYDPAVVVRHKHEDAGRPGWRFYYYDTRNILWVALRRMSVLYGTRYVAIGMTAMMVYSLRDGYFVWWLRAVRDAVRGGREALATRRRWTHETYSRVRDIDRARPGFWRLVKERLLSRSFRLDG